jgi:hypothetical protein
VDVVLAFCRVNCVPVVVVLTTLQTHAFVDVAFSDITPVLAVPLALTVTLNAQLPLDADIDGVVPNPDDMVGSTLEHSWILLPITLLVGDKYPIACPKHNTGINTASRYLYILLPNIRGKYVPCSRRYNVNPLVV